MDRVIEFLKAEAKKENAIIKLILFGSRARGDHYRRSDYDVAVKTEPDYSHAQWSQWALRVQENVPTLCGLDLVQLSAETSSELKEVIANEGKIIYERK